MILDFKKSILNKNLNMPLITPNRYLHGTSRNSRSHSLPQPTLVLLPLGRPCTPTSATWTPFFPKYGTKWSPQFPTIRRSYVAFKRPGSILFPAKFPWLVTLSNHTLRISSCPENQWKTILSPSRPALPFLGRMMAYQSSTSRTFLPTHPPQ